MPPQRRNCAVPGMTHPGWPPARFVAIAVGGAIGAVSRWAVLTALPTTEFPWKTLAVNIVGSLLLGAFLAEGRSHPHARLVLHDAGAIGFCGGLTTFSTYAFEVVQLMQTEHPATALTYTVASVITTITAVIVGAATVRSWRDAGRPVEEAP